MSAKALASNLVYHAHPKHIEFDFHYIHDLVHSHRLDVHYIASTNQLVNLFTKALFDRRKCVMCIKYVKKCVINAYSRKYTFVK